MTNEELAKLIQEGHSEHIETLWRQLERFIGKQAGYYMRLLPDASADEDDLKQAGFFSLVRALKYYDPDKGIKFISYMDGPLKTAFAEVAGKRTSKRDASLYSSSLDEITGEDDDDSIIAFVTDEAAQEAFTRLEDEELCSQTRAVITEALSGFLERPRRLIELLYFSDEKLSIKEAGELCGYASMESASDAKRSTLKRLRNGKYSERLKALLNCFEAPVDIYTAGLRGSNLQSFRNTGESSTERAALRLIAHDERNREGGGNHAED